MKPALIIRTSLGDAAGIGHFMRMLHLAGELLGRDISVRMLLDLNPETTVAGNKAMAISTLYRDWEPFSLDVDARKTIQVLEEYRAGAVIVDDYRIDASWESLVRSAGYHVIAVDDLCRPHSCDLLVDMKWRGEATPTAYDELLTPGTQRLLGPAYVMLGSEYREDRPKRTEPFIATLSVGGGGDGAMLASLAEGILASQEYNASALLLQVVVGPYMANRQVLQQLADGHSGLQLITGATSLGDVLSRTHLYIGALGGTIYELLSLQVPAVTFSIAPNQESPTALLRDLGHYFHIPDYHHAADKDALCALLWTIVEHYGRVSALCRQPRIPVDGEGCRRVADAVVALLEGTPLPPPVKYPPAIFVREGEDLGGGYRLRGVCDHDLGHYLDSRNLPANKQNMLQQQNVREINHYRWWFQTGRSSFLLSKEGEPVLYIWHEKVAIEGAFYLVGGWFVCAGECRFHDAWVALSWQLKYCAATEPGVPWIAVIRKQNRFVRAMNQYLGFQDVCDYSSRLYCAIKAYFTDASEEDFFFVFRQQGESSVTEK